MKNDKVTGNLKKSKLYTSIAYFVACLFFFAAYYLSGIIWFLILAIVFLLAIIGFVFLFRWLENKYLNPGNRNPGEGS